MNCNDIRCGTITENADGTVDVFLCEVCRRALERAMEELDAEETGVADAHRELWGSCAAA